MGCRVGSSVLSFGLLFACGGGQPSAPSLGFGAPSAGKGPTPAAAGGSATPGSAGVVAVGASGGTGGTSGVAAETPSYVIGVKNPPLTDDDGNMAPDTVSNLVGVAEAGGTNTAFIIDTGSPAATSAAFQAAVDAIRGVAIACNLDVPAPPDGRAFEKDHVLVSYTSGGVETELSYDASCAASGSWHYDDLDAPKQVVLCPATCDTVSADATAELAVGFTCEPVIKLPR